MSGLYSVSRHRVIASEKSSEYSTKKVKYLTLDEIRRDGGTQPRVAINFQHVKLLEEQMEDGQQLEPITVFYDGESYWLADGFHRWYAHRNREEEVIACVIHTGSKREAVLYSVGANSERKPALPRSREDKRRAVIALLNDPEWKKWSTTDIARACKVSASFVSHLRRSLFSENSEEQYRTYRTKHGTFAKMRINNIKQSGSKHMQELSIEEKAIAAQSKSECVYLMSDRNYYKIGYTTNILARTYKIKAYNPQIKLLHVIPCSGKDLERKLHYLFNSKRVHGEWFDLDEFDVNLICAISHETSSSLFSENSDEQQQADDRLQAHYLKLIEGGLVKIRVTTNSKINGRLGRIAVVHEGTVEVWVHDVNTMTMHKHTLKHQQVEPVPIDREPELVSVCVDAEQLVARHRLNKLQSDKHRAIVALLTDPEWKEWSDREIALRCKVDHETVGKIRRDLTGEFPSENELRTYKTKHGTVAKMNTNNIGKKASVPLEEHSEGKRVTVKDNHPLFPGQFGKITQLPNPDTAIVELDNGTRELIQLEDLDVENEFESDRLIVAHHLQLAESALVEIHAPNDDKINGRLGRIAVVHEGTVEVWVRDVNTMTMHKHTLKHQQVEPVPMDREPELVEVGDRIARLRKCNLDPFEVEMLLLLERQVAFTPVELRYLAHIENGHGIVET